MMSRGLEKSSGGIIHFIIMKVWLQVRLTEGPLKTCRESANPLL